MAEQSRIISTILSPALRFWLKSQTEHIEELQLTIDAGDRQILSGYIQKVFASAQKAVYQGLHLSQIQLTGAEIRVNLGQVMRGKPLQLLAPVPVTGTVVLQEADLNASLQSPLLLNAVTDVMMQLLKSEITEVVGNLPENQSLQFLDLQAVIGQGQLTLGGTLPTASGQKVTIVLRTGLEVDGQKLRLVRPEWLHRLQSTRGIALTDLDGYIFDLGPEVNLQQLTLEPGQIVCQGEIQVIP